MSQCRMCGGPKVLLGRLGNLIHYRCRNCGAPSSRKVKPKTRLPAVTGKTKP